MRVGNTLAVVAIGASFALAASPATAGNPRLCPGTTKACSYVNSGFQSLISAKTAGQPVTNVSAPNTMSSWENPTSRNGAWYDERDGRGDCYNMLARREVSFVGAAYNDDMKSWRMNNSC